MGGIEEDAFAGEEDTGQDSVTAALEQQVSGGFETAQAEVTDLREGFEDAVLDVTDPAWNPTVTEEPEGGAEIIPFPSTAQTPEAQAEYTQTTLVSPESASANGTGDLDMRLAS